MIVTQVFPEPFRINSYTMLFKTNDCGRFFCNLHDMISA